MSKSPAFFLTRRAALDLRNIYDRSQQEWGEVTADDYMADLYSAMMKPAANPNACVLRQHRAAPFLMVPARQHLVVYGVFQKSVAIDFHSFIMKIINKALSIYRLVLSSFL